MCRLAASSLKSLVLIHLAIFCGGALLSIERNLLISLLKLTENGAVEQKSVNKDARLPASLTSTLLEKLQNENLVYLKEGSVEVDTESRLKLAVKAVELGADVERISDFLRWQEFEAIAAVALELNGYATKKNVRFKHAGRRWEIDVVGCRKPLVLCIDCKHWHHGMHASTLTKMAAAQAERVAAFADSLPSTTIDLPCSKWSKAKFVPVILSLIPFAPKFCDNVPVVPVLQLQDFVSQLPLNVELLRYFSREFSHL
jgi:Holliday junction resolvase-like predicted endonuclease